MEFPQLLFVHHIGCLAHQVDGTLGFRESDHVADGRPFGHEHHQTVQAEGQTPMGRCSEFEGFQQEAEFLLGLFIGETDGFEDLLLDVFPMDTFGTAADFHPVQHHVVGFSIYMARIGEELVHIFIAGSGEGMVHGHITVFFFTVFEHGELHHPGEAQFVLVDEAQALAHFQTQGAQSSGYHQRFPVSHEQQHIAFFRLAGSQDPLHFFVGEEFGNRRLDGAVIVDDDPGQAFGAVDAYEFHQAVQFSPRDLVVAFHVDGFHQAALFDDVLEHLELGPLESFIHVDQLHAEPQVRFVAAVFVHGFIPGHPGHGHGHIYAQGFLEHIGNQLFSEGHDVILVHKGHFHIQLGEFRLTVGPQVFIPEAPGDLEVPFHPRNHQQLFEQLGRLRQCVELARVHTAGHQVVPSPLRGAPD